MALTNNKPMTEEELRKLSGSTFGSTPLQMGGFGSPFGVAAPRQMPYDTQTNKIVGSSYSPSRSSVMMPPTNFTLGATDSYAPPAAGQGGGNPVVSMPPMDFPIGPTTSQSAVGQNLVTQQPARAPVLPYNLANPTVNPEPVGMGTTVRIANQYGTGSTTLTLEQQAQRAQERQRAEQMGTLPRTPEQQQALLAQARQTGAAIGQTMREREKSRQQELTKGYYAFRERIAQDRAQQALSQEGGRSPNVRRGAQALLEAEEMRQIQAGRAPMSREPLSAFGLQFDRGSMGQFQPRRGFGDNWAMDVVSGGPQPARPATTPEPSTFWQTATGGSQSAMAAPAAPQVPEYIPFASRQQQPSAEDPLERFKSAIGPSRVARRRRTTMPVPILSRV